MAKISPTLFDLGENASMDEMYVICAKDGNGHYRIADIKNNRLVYGKAIAFPLHEILEYDWDLLGSDVEIVWITRAWADIDAFIAAYMPKKRSRITPELRLKVYNSYGGHCAYCGCKIAYEEMQVDHVESHYRHGGRDEESNYLPSCADCNGLKSDYTLDEFRLTLIPRCLKKAKRLNNDRSSRICRKYGLFGNKNKQIVFYFEKKENQ